jgi:hypothetical protein
MHRRCRVAALFAAVFIVGSAAARPTHAQAPGQPTATGRVTVNRIDLTTDIVQALAQYGIQVAPGDYWYDAASGLYGMSGGPGLGFTMPGLQLGGPLRPDASGGGTGTLTNVFVNGRELHPQDVAALSALGPVYPGRYWLRFDGWYGMEGGMPLGNLIALSQQATGGAGYNRSVFGAGHLGSDGQTSYFFDPNSGCSVISGGGTSC